MESIKKYVDRFFLKTKKNSKYGMSFSEMQHGIKEVLFNLTDRKRPLLIEMKEGGESY